MALSLILGRLRRPPRLLPLDFIKTLCRNIGKRNRSNTIPRLIPWTICLKFMNYAGG